MKYMFSEQEQVDALYQYALRNGKIPNGRYKLVSSQEITTDHSTRTCKVVKVVSHIGLESVEDSQPAGAENNEQEKSS